MSALTKIVVEDYSLEDSVFTCFATDYSTHEVPEWRARLAYKSKDMQHVEAAPTARRSYAYRAFEDWLGDAGKAATGKDEHAEVCALLSEIVNEQAAKEPAYNVPDMPRFSAMLNMGQGILERHRIALAGYNPPSLQSA